MFDNDIDQSVLVLVVPLVALSALPFFMAWVESTLDGEPVRMPHPWRSLGRATAATMAWCRSTLAHR